MIRNKYFIALLVTSVIVFGTTKLYAQIKTSKATTSILISINDFISIGTESVAIGDFVVSNYFSTDDYKNSKSENNSNSLVVTSSRNFGILLKADGRNFTDKINNFPVEIWTIKPVEEGALSGIPKTLNLSTMDQTLVGISSYGSSLILHLDYEIPTAKATSNIFGYPPGDYVQTITYTAVPL